MANAARLWQMIISKETMETIVWLAGSLAGFSGIVYGFGYLIIRTNLNVLGFDAPLTYSTDNYLEEGGKFLFAAAILVVERVLLVGGVLAFFLLGLLLLFFLVALVVFPFKRRRSKEAIAHARTRWLKATKRNRWTWRGPVFWLLILSKQWTKKATHSNWAWRGPVFALLVFLLIWHLVPPLEGWVYPTLGISDLAYDQADTDSCDRNDKISNQDQAKTEISNQNEAKTENQTEAETIRNWLLNGCTDRLESRFENALLLTLVAGLLLVFAWRTVATWRFRFWLTLPFMLMFIIYLTLLPMVYGVLMKPTEFSRIEVRLTTDKPSAASENLFLLGMTAQEFILWDAKNKRTLVVLRGAVLRAEIMERDSPFKPAGGNQNQQ